MTKEPKDCVKPSLKKSSNELGFYFVPTTREDSSVCQDINGYNDKVWHLDNDKIRNGPRPNKY